MIDRRALCICLVLAGCLDPLVDDEVGATGVFGDPSIEPAAAPHVEDDPAFAENVALFTDRIDYLQGYASGEPVRYWNVRGPNASFVAPMFVVLGPGENVGRPIIDVLPGELGYSPWWRLITVRTTEKYAGERVWSRAAIDAGLRLGILEAPEPTEEILDCPVVRRGIAFDLGEGRTGTSSWVWYRNRRVDWVDFEIDLRLPADERQMPIFPVYVLQRIDQPQPIYEAQTGVDLNGDGVLDASNNVFSGGPGEERYSPLWYEARVRTAAGLPSIDTASRAVVRAETDLIDASGQPRAPLILSIEHQTSVLVNCPIQRTPGEL